MVPRLAANNNYMPQGSNSLLPQQYHHQGSHSGSQGFWTNATLKAPRKDSTNGGLAADKQPVVGEVSASQNPALLKKSQQTY